MSDRQVFPFEESPGRPHRWPIGTTPSDDWRTIAQAQQFQSVTDSNSDPELRATPIVHRATTGLRPPTPWADPLVAAWRDIFGGMMPRTSFWDHYEERWPHSPWEAAA
jgi:hypothetical protein